MDDSDREALRDHDYAPSKFSIHPANRLQVNDMEEEFNFRYTIFHLPENRRTSTTGLDLGWLLSKNDPLSGGNNRSGHGSEDGSASSPVAMDASDTMIENDAATVARKALAFMPSIQSTIENAGPAGMNGPLIGGDNGVISPFSFSNTNLQGSSTAPFVFDGLELSNTAGQTQMIGANGLDAGGSDDWSLLFGQTGEPQGPLTDFHWMMNM